jgi:hypothetical protein
MKTVAGIGSRSINLLETPKVIEATKLLFDNYFNLRSGGALGCDTLFEKGYRELREHYKVDQPSSTIFYHDQSYFSSVTHEKFYVRSSNWDKAKNLAAKYHPAWGMLTSPYSRNLITRNVLIVLGQELKQLVDLVVCWTVDGADGSETNPTTRKTGGTGQAIRIARAFEIPVFNLKNKSVEDLEKFLVTHFND